MKYTLHFNNFILSVNLNVYQVAVHRRAQSVLFGISARLGTSDTGITHPFECPGAVANGLKWMVWMKWKWFDWI
jgi:hypothetical protein